jgi:Terminase RNaseH-like domain/Terminase large subunit, T4likevirus-type, N-terminal
VIATTARLELPRLHPGQRRLLEHRGRFAVVACGRRFGKTTLAVDLAARTVIGGQPAGWFAPTYQLLADAWRLLKRRLGPAIARVSEVEHRLELVTGGVLECWSMDGPDPARGRKYARVVLDEASIVRDLDEVWHAAIRPTLTDLAGDALILGTPKGHNGFWRLFGRGLAGDATWSAYTAPTADNPHIDPAEIAAARRDMPDRTFRQEYLATFLEDGGGVLRRVRDAATATRQDRAQEGHAYRFGVDWGRTTDATAIAVYDTTLSACVALDRFTDTAYAVQVGRLKGLVERFRPTTVVAERNGMGEPLVELLQRERVPVRPFLTTNQSKADLIDALALAFETEALTIVDDPVLIAELEAFEAERLPSGLVRYGAPAGGHDDCVLALAMAYGVHARRWVPL